LSLTHILAQARQGINPIEFRRPVFADETVLLEWLVIKVTPNARLGGHIVDLRGRIRGQDGQTAVGAKGRVLVTDSL